MHKIELFAAKKKLSELVERANRGEQIGITHRGKLAAVIVSPRTEATLQHIFDEIEGIRKRAGKTRKLNVKSLVEDSRG
jgi:prevent-host-death family protein